MFWGSHSQENGVSCRKCGAIWIHHRRYVRTARGRAKTVTRLVLRDGTARAALAAAREQPTQERRTGRTPLRVEDGTFAAAVAGGPRPTQEKQILQSGTDPIGMGWVKCSHGEWMPQEKPEDRR